jgi:hypothetical protein
MHWTCNHRRREQVGLAAGDVRNAVTMAEWRAWLAGMELEAHEGNRAWRTCRVCKRAIVGRTVRRDSLVCSDDCKKRWDAQRERDKRARKLAGLCVVCQEELPETAIGLRRTCSAKRCLDEVRKYDLAGVTRGARGVTLLWNHTGWKWVVACRKRGCGGLYKQYPATELGLRRAILVVALHRKKEQRRAAAAGGLAAA